ncbi:hypothetical protein [Natrinema altunense]|uniref:Uncharacterized protein n=1 Tax=Natrinema altunense TaxID=222984 RepID=A0A482XYJ5_9EURY|nr:hypothetical protein [Natrinema altunense]RZH67610.1 hypothetical protein ELS17_12195 [Natrinema altunense]
MTESSARDGREVRSDPGRVERSSSRLDETERTTGPPRRVMTDGGQAEMEGADDQPEDASDADAAHEEADADAEEGGADPAESEEPQGGEDESEGAVESEDEDEKGDTEEEVAVTEGEAEDETEAEEGEGDEETVETDGEDADGEEKDEYHVEDAEDVYQDDETAGVLHLDLDGLFLDLLGLEVNLNPVTLDVSARPGGNNLLGNLLSAVTGLLDGPGAVLDKVQSLLGKPKELLGSLVSKPKKLLSNVLGKPREWLSSALGKPREWLSGLFGGGTGEPAAADEPDAEETKPAAADDEEAEPSEGDETPGRISRAASWLREKLSGLVPSFPTEEIVAVIVSKVIEQLIERLEPQREEEAGGQAEPSQAEASS